MDLPHEAPDAVGPAGGPASREAGWLTWKRADVDGRAAVYGEAGEGPTVVFLHGWGLDHKAYKRALSRLVTAGVHVVAPALPGFGGTAPLPRGAGDLADFVRWVRLFLDEVGIRESVLMMGHSLGGGIAIRFAYEHTDRTRALVLINSIGGSAWTHKGSTIRSMAERPLWDWGIHLPADIFPVRQARKVLPVSVAEALPNLLRDPRAFWASAGVARRADLTTELDELRRRCLPVVVLWGRSDQIVTQDSFKAMCLALGSPHVITVPGTHSWLIADPDAFGEVMTNVLEVVGLTDAQPTR